MNSVGQTTVNRGSEVALTRCRSPSPAQGSNPMGKDTGRKHEGISAITDLKVFVSMT